MEPFIGQIIQFGGNFAPRGWATCDGQLLAIQSNAALFSILGTTYGGDGVTTFGLPDLRGRMAMHAGHGNGLTTRPLGSKGGEESVTLNSNQMPSHSHELRCQASQGDLGTPNGNFLAGDRTGADDVYSASHDSAMNADAVRASGSGQAHDNMSPYQCVTFIIALQGVFPSRN